MGEETNLESKPLRRRHRAVKWIAGIVGGLLLLVVLAVASLYVPGTLNMLLRRFAPSIEESSGLRVTADNISLKFPLRLSIDNLLVLDVKQTGDTMIAAGRADLSLSATDLLSGRLSLDDGRLRGALYRMGGRDSMYLSARLDSAGIDGYMDLSANRIELRRADIKGGLVHLVIGTDTTSTPADTTSAPLDLILNNVRLRDVTYAMYMSASNDTIAASISDAKLDGGRILAADTVSITASTIALWLDSALYGTRGVEPMPGFDLSWLTVEDALVEIDSFNMRGPSLTIPFKTLDADDFAGMRLASTGTFAMSSGALSARNFDLRLGERSWLRLDAEMGLDTVAPAPVRLNAEAELFADVIAGALPAAAPLLASLPADKPFRLRALAGGTMADLRVDTIGVEMPGVFSLGGYVLAGNLADSAGMTLDATMKGRVENSAPVASLLPKGVKLPPLRLQLDATARGDNYSAKLSAVTAAGRLALDGRLKGVAPDYSVSFRADSFPVAAFMPGLGIGAVSASVNARGHRLNPLARGAAFDVNARVTDVQMAGRRIGGISLDAALERGELSARLGSTAAPANLDLDLMARLTGKSVDWRLTGDIRRLDLQALGLADSTMNARMRLESQGYATFALDSIAAGLCARNVAVGLGRDVFTLDSLGLTADAGAQTALHLGNGALRLDFNSSEPLEATLGHFGNAATLASAMIAARNINTDSLVGVLPRFNLDLSALPDSPVNQFLNDSDMNINTLTLKLRKDSLLSGRALVTDFRSGENMRIDTVAVRLLTADSRLLLAAEMHNRPGTMDEFADVELRGSFSGNRGHFNISQQNIAGQTGYRLGFVVGLADSIVGLRIKPANPVIAYKNWTVNEDNYVAVNPYTFRIHANLDAAGGGSRLQLRSKNVVAEVDSITDVDNELYVRISDIHLQDWLNINPFAPPITGNVSADLDIAYTNRQVSGSGTVSLTSLTYGKKPVGDFNMNLDLATAFGGAIHANVGLDVNGRRALNAIGAINDTTRSSSPVNMFVQLKEFPLSIANPFLASTTAQLSGSLNGRMGATGSFSALKLNGSLHFKQTRINVGMMGSAFSLDSVDIPVDSNLVRFNHFAITGSNANPLYVDGIVNVNDFSSPGINLNLTARNMQIINSKKAKGVDLFGRGFIDLDATVKGNTDFMSVNAKLDILAQTNLTYQVSNAMVAAGLQPEEDVVKFVNLADTTRVMQADTVAAPTSMMMLSALLNVHQGSQFTVNLSADGQNRAQIKGQGILDYTMSPTQPDGRLTGRFTIDGGSFRYSLPIISEKLFTFKQGSYVAFNGPVLNPTLAITATDQVKANVTRAGENSRLVNFDVILNATGTPERLDVAFDLSTKDDLTVQNELQSMSPTQRANQAMNLLLYGTYSSMGTTGDANMSGNALYGFLTSQLNNWAANSIKGVDVSFGLDQFDRTRDGSTSTTTQYSYKVSKSLFNDRFKIVVGGNYSTDADADENLTQNLISDVSFEYMLNQSGSMYVRLFRHTGFESILEGEVTQTGVGFVVRRKISRLADIFNLIKAAKQ